MMPKLLDEVLEALPSFAFYKITLPEKTVLSDIMTRKKFSDA